MSTRVNLSDTNFHIGESITIEATCLDADGAPIDLTGATIAFRLASRTAHLLDATMGSGVSMLDAKAGKCRIVISPAMQLAAAVPPGDHLYELRVITAAGAVTTQAEGAISLADSLFRKYA